MVVRRRFAADPNSIERLIKLIMWVLDKPSRAGWGLLYLAVILCAAALVIVYIVPHLGPILSGLAGLGTCMGGVLLSRARRGQ